MTKIPTLKLNTGAEIPQVGLGLWRVLPGFVCRRVVKDGLEAGYKHFDTAQAYFNESQVGRAIKKSGVEREKLFITTKIQRHHFEKVDLVPSFEESLEKLRTDYLDLLLLHFPQPEYRQEAWSELEKLYKDGRAKAIGVSNYTVRHLHELLSHSKVVPAVNQVEMHVYLQQSELLEFCKKHGIVVEAYSPLAHGHGISAEPLVSIAKKHNKTPAQIMLRWCIEQRVVILPKTTHAERMRENLDIFDFALDDHDLNQIKDMNQDLHTCWDPTNVP